MILSGISKIVKMVLVLLMIPVSIVFGQDTQVDKWSLEECIEYALDNNLSVKQGEFNVDDSEVQFRQSKGGMYPTANMGGGYTNLWGRSIDPTTNRFTNDRIQSLGLQLSANYTLYGGSQRRNSVKQNRLNMASSNFDLEKAKNDKQIQITEAQAHAESMRIKANALKTNRSLIEYEAIQKWDGNLPQFMMGSGGAVPFINLTPAGK